MAEEPVSFLMRLKQHHLYGVTVAYAIVMGFLIQLVSRAFPYFGWTGAVPAVIIILLLGFPVVIVLAWLFIKPKDTAESKSALTLAPSAATDIFAKSIAVLPFVNDSSNPKQQYFSDGLSEDLILALNQYQGLTVIGRESSFKMRNTNLDSRQIGEKLGVTHLLEGSVSRAGRKVRVRAELIETRNGHLLWSDRYDRPYKNLFALQDEITKSVATALKAKLLDDAISGAVVQTGRPPNGNLDAYNAWLQGRFYSVRLSDKDLREAISEYDRAIEIDLTYAQAYADRSYTRAVLASNFMSGQAKTQGFTRARKDAHHALSIAPDLVEAHLALGYLLEFADLNPIGAESEFRKAVELAPNNPDPKTHFGMTLAALGHADEGIAQIRRAVQLDPLNSRSYRSLADVELGLGRLDEAEQAIREAIALQPDAGINRRTLVYIYVRRGNAAAALHTAQLEPSEAHREWETTIALQIGSDRHAADAALADFIAKMAGYANFQIAEAYVVRNEPDEAFAWLHHAWAVRDPGVITLLYDPFLFSYRGDPRFGAFCRKVGLPAPGSKAHEPITSPEML